MARAKRLDPCMFCGEAPCVCNKKTKARPRVKDKPEAKRPSPKASEPEPEKRSSVFAAMKALAKPVVQGTSHHGEPERSAPSGSLDDAIRALAPILHPQEKARYQSVLNTQPSLQERREAWKKKM